MRQRNSSPLGSSGQGISQDSSGIFPGPSFTVNFADRMNRSFSFNSSAVRCCVSLGDPYFHRGAFSHHPSPGEVLDALRL
jgi:hypothetical protein